MLIRMGSNMQIWIQSKSFTLRFQCSNEVKDKTAVERMTSDMKLTQKALSQLSHN